MFPPQGANFSPPARDMRLLYTHAKVFVRASLTRAPSFFAWKRSPRKVSQFAGGGGKGAGRRLHFATFFLVSSVLRTAVRHKKQEHTLFERSAAGLEKVL